MFCSLHCLMFTVFVPRLPTYWLWFALETPFQNCKMHAVSPLFVGVTLEAGHYAQTIPNCC